MERTYTTKEKIRNWLYYHIWHLAAAALLLAIAASVISNKVSQRKETDDYCIAYIATAELPSECLRALKSEIGALGVDVNGDGEVTVKINQYIPSTDTATYEEAAYGRAAEVAILTDIREGESYFFLVEYPEDFQLDFQLMAHLDGAASDEDDFGVWDKVYSWADCPALTALDLGTSATESGGQIENQALLGKLYLGRRCFLDPRMKSNSPENAALWDILTAGASLPKAGDD